MIPDFLTNLLASLVYDPLKVLRPRQHPPQPQDLERERRDELHRQTQALEALQTVLVRLSGERAVRIEVSAT
ncbi:hypothetical protein [Roseiflexus castenholzii]|uniref:Uncharacterized protein n=1 Tax=Roseiflexus castenholzii (strain DSM 13941 / HLO8) TaxID=383372 RepID=A7NJM3_ROSCS|nr:hypothetical protein [Roseiflexus castenholzii]ABU57693.1 hypothetical protein Rcas_1600 [Roseiflexus castenholzii DSM 13941]